MRKSAISDCIRILKHFGVDPSCGEAIDVFGEHLIYITRPGGYIYVATVFEWMSSVCFGVTGALSVRELLY